MNGLKNSVLRLQFQKIVLQDASFQDPFVIKIELNSDQRILECPQSKDKKEGKTLIIQETLQFYLANQNIKRQSKCIISLISQKKDKQVVGKIDFGVMNYKNYTRSQFQLCDDQKTKGTLYMNINISNSQSPKKTQSQKKQKHKTVQKPSKSVLAFPHSQSLNISFSSQQSRQPKKIELQNIKPSKNLKVKDIKPINMQQAEKIQPVVKRKVNIIEPVSIKQSSTCETTLMPEVNIIGPAAQSSKLTLANLDIFAKKEENLKEDFNLRNTSAISPRLQLPVDNYKQKEKYNKSNFLGLLKRTNTISSTSFNFLSQTALHSGQALGHIDSQYTKCIEKNMQTLSLLKSDISDVDSLLLQSRSPSKMEETEENLFVTLARMKSKFESIQQKQNLIDNDQYLDMLAEQNQQLEQEQSQQQEKYDKKAGVFYSVKLNNQRNFQKQYMDKSHLSYKSINNFKLSTHRVLSYKFQVVKGHAPFKITKVLSEIFGTEEFMQSSTRKKGMRYKLVSKKQSVEQMYNQSNFLSLGHGTLMNPALGQTMRNNEVENQSLKIIQTIKLNKIPYYGCTIKPASHNQLLLKANQEAIQAKKRMENQLFISKKVISEKENMLQKQFQQLRQQLETISQKLASTNKQSDQRQAKIKSLETQIEVYVRQLSKKKQSIVEKSKTIKNLRYMLFLKDQKEKKDKKNHDKIENEKQDQPENDKKKKKNKSEKTQKQQVKSQLDLQPFLKDVPQSQRQYPKTSRSVHLSNERRITSYMTIRDGSNSKTILDSSHLVHSSNQLTPQYSRKPSIDANITISRFDSGNRNNRSTEFKRFRQSAKFMANDVSVSSSQNILAGLLKKDLAQPPSLGYISQSFGNI